MHAYLLCSSKGGLHISFSEMKMRHFGFCGNIKLTHFAYISGRGRELVVPRTDEYDQKSPFEDKDFDEDAFLSGKIPIFNEAPQERPAKGKLYLLRLHVLNSHMKFWR